MGGTSRTLGQIHSANLPVERPGILGPGDFHLSGVRSRWPAPTGSAMGRVACRGRPLLVDLNLVLSELAGRSQYAAGLSDSRRARDARAKRDRADDPHV